ncbi:hypothetical protein WB401_19265 [Streptomyces brasiliscabiei]|uniref:Ribbon-helix-helix protein CopG domain-containing protein n=2 Tax=Streptomyces TaxID=1883 RepID=A0ABU8GM69_9ACTN|nr:hypothetical protein [Streptomyces griseiscabiei]MBZ3901097.1 hypothetical protein [Streptomyces griseiscabiei]MDX2908772.1 hypothetical protein [Streptomyces griseiscabiei]
MTEITLHLAPDRLRALADLADAQGRRPEELVEAAVETYLRAESGLVRARAERLAEEHAELLRRLGE